ncbi:DUF6056 family protein [Chishuiella sp.]|uniref:DUF6056 family protein n=1 Tax=Chishuiella sp. TaxID=1969467 RepID=UPI0028AB3A91|nr:DUF6056 family protein [Chishuiella sp.]
MKNNKLFILNALIIYIIILIPSLNTPFQSDDYSYFLKGISWENSISHYMGWSGRLITDFTSSFLLKYLPYIIYESLNACVFLLLCLFISIIPKLIIRNNVTNSNFSSVTLWIVFLAYWISNPNLGQTSFWIVGSANYLWTIMWASLYFVLILYITNIKKELEKNDYLYIVILGFLAGCSNENTSVSVVLFTFTLFFIEQRKKIISVGFLSSLIGALVLLLAPGNRVRMQTEDFWYSLSTKEQLRIHIYERMPNAISQYLHIYLLIITALIILILIKKKINNKSILYVGVFFILSLFSNFILAKSPIIGGRNLNTGLFFLLPVLAIIVYEFQNSKSREVKLSNFILIGYSLLFFIPSYIYFTFMMVQSKNQYQIRENIINTVKKDNKDTITIPDWNFTRLLKPSDAFDTYRSPSMPEYYGVKNITYKIVNFNYGALIEGDKYPINKNLKGNLKILNIYNYTIDPMDFTHKKGIIIEFNESIKNYIQEGDNLIFIHFIDKKGQFINSDRLIDSEIELNNKFYIDTSLDKIRISNLEKIIIGFYNTNTQKESTEIEIKLDK